MQYNDNLKVKFNIVETFDENILEGQGKLYIKYVEKIFTNIYLFSFLFSFFFLLSFDELNDPFSIMCELIYNTSLKKYHRKLPVEGKTILSGHYNF